MDKDYICGCGKAYGSYPAFSTHRKTKHQNVTVPGTVLPTQQKAKRGRPSCDFKKIPEVDERKKEYYQGLNIIQYGLLDLQQKYKGKILSQPHQSNQFSFDSNLQSCIKQFQQRISAIAAFTKLLTIHTQATISQQIIYFFTQLIKFGIQTSQLTSIQLYNNYCINNIKQLVNSDMGIGFYVDICLLLSRWMCVMGYQRQILRVKNRDSYSKNYHRNQEIIEDDEDSRARA